MDHTSGSAEHDPAAVLQAAASVGLLDANAMRAAALLRLFSTEADMARIVGTIHEEPALTARVLRVANSAYYGQRGTVASIDRAVSILGVNAVRSIAATGCFDHAISRRLAAAYGDWTKVRQHSLSTAILAEHFATERHPKLRDLAFTAGLLHDLGVAIEALLDPRTVEARVRSAGSISDEAWVNALHAGYAATVAQHWHFPDELVSALAHHHDDDTISSDSPPSLSALLKSATDDAARLGYVHALEAPAAGTTTAEGLDLNRERLDSLGSLVRDRIANIVGECA